MAQDCGCARWQPDTCTALVLKSKGKYMSTMGFAFDGQRLFPEEAVFLADREEIQLVIATNEEGLDGKDRVLSKIEAFSLLETCAIDMRAYTVYAALREQRFHVYRHGAWKETGKAWRNLASPQIIRVPPEDERRNVLLDEKETDDGEEKKGKSKRVRLSELLGAPTEEDAVDRRGLQREVEHPGIEKALFVSFDAYKPQSGFSRTRMSKPDFSLVILSADGRMPSVGSLRTTVQQCDAGVPIRLAIVGDSSLTFVEVDVFDPRADTTNDEKRHSPKEDETSSHKADDSS